MATDGDFPLFDTRGCESKLAPPEVRTRQNFNYCAATKLPDKASARANVVGHPFQSVTMHPFAAIVGWSVHGLLRFYAPEVAYAPQATHHQMPRRHASVWETCLD